MDAVGAQDGGNNNQHRKDRDGQEFDGLLRGLGRLGPGVGYSGSLLSGIITLRSLLLRDVLILPRRQLLLPGRVVSLRGLLLLRRRIVSLGRLLLLPWGGITLPGLLRISLRGLRRLSMAALRGLLQLLRLGILLGVIGQRFLLPGGIVPLGFLLRDVMDSGRRNKPPAGAGGMRVLCSPAVLFLTFHTVPPGSIFLSVMITNPEPSGFLYFTPDSVPVPYTRWSS